jgi:hypothetical protein
VKGKLGLYTGDTHDGGNLFEENPLKVSNSEGVTLTLFYSPRPGNNGLPLTTSKPPRQQQKENRIAEKESACPCFSRCIVLKTKKKSGLVRLTHFRQNTTHTPHINRLCILFERYTAGTTAHIASPFTDPQPGKPNCQ